MKKKLFSTGMVIYLLALLVGCTGTAGNNIEENKDDTPSMAEKQLALLYEEIDDSGLQAGIAYIGYVGYEATEVDVRDFVQNSAYPEKYSFLCDAPLVDASGPELYAIVTTRDDRSATVYSAEMNENGKYVTHKDDMLYKGVGTDCILLRCNMSEIHSNVTVEIKTGDERFSVNPMLSGMDGRIVDEGLYDFSIYFNGDMGVCDPEMNAYGVLEEYDEIQYYEKQGMVLLYTGETEEIEGKTCMIFAMGTDHGDQFVRERFYGVSEDKVFYYDPIDDKWIHLGMG